MSWPILSQLGISGLSIGSIYALVGLALVLPYKASGAVNFAQGEMVTVGAYMGLVLAGLGLPGLDLQAKTLGLSRSTTWTILHANHKSSGLSAKVINRMLVAPNLPALVRTKVLEYAEEKVAGRYGHSNVARNRFATLLSVDLIDKKASSSDGKSLPRNARARPEKRNTPQTDAEPDRKRLRLGQRGTS